MKKVLMVLLFWVMAKPVEAKYATIVNPVRDRELWVTDDLEWIDKQYREGVAATWLAQYDVLEDEGAVDRFGQMDDKQEMGMLVEVSPKWGKAAGVVVDENRPWYDPGVVFLSAYEREERRSLIDSGFKKFEEVFGAYPQSVGAWWIDSYSLEYMREKYGIKTAMIVADQKTTDNFGVWGQWWGAAYRASRHNILMPSKEGVAIIQWAQRDPKLAVGEGWQYSNYSLQANDYLERGRDIEFFKQLVDLYGKTGQVTVGLEVGQEGAKNIDEYQKQIDYLMEREDLEKITMSEFGERFEMKERVEVGDWKMDLERRTNKVIGEKIEYKRVAFGDYFVADKAEFLDRRLPIENKNDIGVPWWIGAWLAGLGWAVYKKKFGWWLGASLFLWLGFGLILRTRQELGWQVVYEEGLEGFEWLVVVMVLTVFWLVKESKWLVVGFLAEPMLRVFRVSLIEGEYWAGMMIDNFKFAGVGFKDSVRFFVKDLPWWQARGLLKFEWPSWWMRIASAIIIAIGLRFLVLKLNKRVRWVILAVVVILLIWQGIWIARADPVAVKELVS